MLQWIIRWSFAFAVVAAYPALGETSTPASAPASRPAMAAELLGQPCRAKQVLGASVVVDRQDGRERLILLNDNETTGCELLYIDFEKDTGERFAAPAGSGSWCGIEVPGDQYVVGTFYDGTFMVFDLRGKKFTRSARFPGEGYLWNLVLGSDGRVYGGTYPGAKLGALTIETGAVEDLGAPAVPNQYLRYVSFAPWGQVLANFGMTNPTTRIYDIPSKSWREVPGLNKGETLGVGATWNGHFIATSPRTGSLEAFKDASFEPVLPRPFPLPADGKASLVTALTTATTLYISQGTTLYRYTAGAARFELEKLTDLDLRGGRFVGVTKEGSLLGVRGQSYFVLPAGETELKLRPIPVESNGRPLMFLKPDAQGRLWGGPHFGQTLFYYDTNTGKTVNTETICDGGGEVYDVAFRDGLVYAASYAGGDITCYDPKQPWDQWHRKNPRPVASVSPAYIRPTGGIVAAPDGRLYAGWTARYGEYGGAVSITDADSGKTELIENPLGKQAVSALAVDRKFIYVGTNLAGNGLPNQPGDRQFGVIDRTTRKVVFQQALGVDRIAFEPRTGTVILVGDARLYRYEAERVTEILIDGLPGLSGRPVLTPGDGTLIVAAGSQILRIDLQKKTFALLVKAETRIETLARDGAGRLYFSQKADLYRATLPTTTPSQSEQP